MRPSPQPRSYTVSPGLILAISSIRSTTCVGDATYGASLLTYLGSWEKPGTARSASRTALAQRITYLNGGLIGPHWEATDPGPLPCLDCTIRATISDTANHTSRGRVTVNSAPCSSFTARLIESLHGTACGYRL